MIFFRSIGFVKLLRETVASYKDAKDGSSRKGEFAHKCSGRWCQKGDALWRMHE